MAQASLKLAIAAEVLSAEYWNCRHALLCMGAGDET